MQSIHIVRLLAIAGIAPLVALPAAAQDSYYFFGLGAGKSRSDIDAAGITASQGPAGLSINNVARDAKDNAYRAFLGYQFNRYVGLEVGYFHLGQFKFDSATSAGTLHGETNVQGASVDVLGTVPLTDNFSAIGRLGVNWARTRGTYTGGGGFVPNSPTPSQRQVNGDVGIGLQYAFNPSFLVRAEIERFRFNDAVGHHPNANLYSVSLVVPFGRSAASAPRVAYVAPAYVAPAPMAAPAPVVKEVVVVAVAAPTAPPVAPAPRRVSYSAESMFSFDRAVLRPEGKAALDKFAMELRGTTFDSVSVEGFTDRLGKADYNQKLSQERADVVKAYLVETGNVDASKVRAVGKGEGTPLTLPDDCKGTAATAKLIACLQPDRRVEIEVAGTQ
jgi:OOP family OmpA-OmpF porin